MGRKLNPHSSCFLTIKESVPLLTVAEALERCVIGKIKEEIVAFLNSGIPPFYLC
jgi:hypothetical protein